MKVGDLLTLLVERDVRLKPSGDRLIVNAPSGALTPELAAAIRDNKAEILAVLSEISDGSDTRYVRGPEPSSEATGCLSPSQERLWTVSQLDPANPRYSLCDTLRLQGTLDVSALERALQAVCERHGLLRSRFVSAAGGEARVVTEEDCRLTLERIDLSGYPSERVESIARDRMEALAMVPFDLTNEPALRAYLVSWGSDEHLLGIVTHAIIWDAASFEILVRETGQFYTQFVGRPSVMPAELRLRYDDYAYWQRLRQEAPDTRAAVAYWKGRLAGDLSPHPLPADIDSEGESVARGARIHAEIPRALSAAVHAYCRRSGVTPFMLWLAAYVLLLSRYSDSETLVVTTTVQGRDSPELERLIGTFTNHIFLGFEVDERRSFEDHVVNVRDIALDGFAHQNCAAESVIEALDVDLARSRLFQLNFTYRHSGGRPHPWGEVLILPGPVVDAHGINGDLALWMDETPKGEVTVDLSYRADRFSEGMITRLLDRLLSLLEQGLARPDLMLLDMSLSLSSAITSGRTPPPVVPVPAAVPALIGKPEQEKAEQLARMLGLCPGDRLMIADSGGGDAGYRIFERVAARSGVVASTPSRYSAHDERSLYSEISACPPEVLVTGVPMAAALSRLDTDSRVLGATTLIVNPRHAHPEVLRELIRSFSAVHYVLTSETHQGPILFAAGRAESGAVCVEPLEPVELMVVDRLGRASPIGVDGEIVLGVSPEEEGELRVPAGCRGRWLSADRIRVTAWHDRATLYKLADRLRGRLAEQPGVVDAHVEIRRADTGAARLLVWVEQSFGAEQTTTSLRDALSDLLPGRHCPTLIVDVPALPRRSDGSVVRERLPDPFGAPGMLGFELPRAGTEQSIAEIWADILGTERIGAHDSFAELGGTSLQALRVIQQMQLRLGWRVEPRLLFFQSLRRVAEYAPKDAIVRDRAA
ncbi:condensation domain-containing protein [Thiocapsa marina]|uniref:Ornithine racemase., Phenylalanine racemase (ATP-hydrolyzing) n=1 Tax=Thiocapsa marina 5811 TaxID=768671 RepID=F9UAS4_9GAMM|nr:condensation domain-containing protein [Thiocapsa marina]EGV18542.1 Ornithine racemase., Phenylalanine racemase (ATP-hydrolyzing) [Thiocapsa marina 5811]